MVSFHQMQVNSYHILVIEGKEMERSKGKDGIQMQSNLTCELESKTAVKTCQEVCMAFWAVRQKYNMAPKR